VVEVEVELVEVVEVVGIEVVFVEFIVVEIVKIEVEIEVEKFRALLLNVALYVGYTVTLSWLGTRAFPNRTNTADQVHTACWATEGTCLNT
jgi:hypothetical protein